MKERPPSISFWQRFLLRRLIALQLLRPPGLGLMIRLNARLVSWRWKRRGRSYRSDEQVLESGGRIYRIRRLAVADVDELVKFLHAEIPRAERHFIPHRTGCRGVRGLLTSGGLLPLGVWSEAGELCAYGLCRPTIMRTALFAVMVAPRARRHGLGTAILRYLAEWAIGLEQTPFSLAFAANTSSLGMLRAAGFSLSPLDDDYFLAWYDKPH